MKTRDQERAAFVLAEIEKSYPDGIPKEHANYFAGLPTMILENGLGQTMVFLLSKSRDTLRDNNKYSFSYRLLRKYLFSNLSSNEQDRYPNDIETLKSLIDKPIQEYFEAQRKAIAVATWLKRYAKALVRSDDNPSNSNKVKEG
ncbi:MAG TPA: type III-B CRISPR module-associated protein Cmr5 [Rectinema sp.]|nr:type III-B CRISPR module-associated protein Cmr5 [Rectinema sp.]